jgi:hypothetical protein
VVEQADQLLAGQVPPLVPAVELDVPAFEVG